MDNSVLITLDNPHTVYTSLCPHFAVGTTSYKRRSSYATCVFCNS